MKCTRENEVSVLSSGSGFYIGTIDAEDGAPYCRVSEYYRNKVLAETALEKMTFTVRNCIENQFCSGGRCFVLVPKKPLAEDHVDGKRGN